MAEKELNLSEEEDIEVEIDDDALNLDEEDDFEVEEDDSAPELSDDEKERIALEVHNKKTGKNYKTWEDVVKSEKQRDIAFAQNPQKKKVEVKQPDNAQPVATSGQLDADIVEEVMLTSFPELRNAPETRAELKELAELKGISELSLYKQSTYFKSKAKGEASENEEVEENRSRVTPPSGTSGIKKTVKATPEDVRIANQFFKGDVAKYLKHKATQRK